MAYVSAQRMGHVNRVTQDHLPPRAAHSFSRASPATQAINALSNEVATVGMKLSEGVATK